MAKIYQNRGGTLTSILDTDKFVSIENTTQSIAGTKTFSGTVNVPDSAAGNSSSRAANTKFVTTAIETLGTFLEGTLNVDSAIAANTNITLPGGLKYRVGSNKLTVSYNGLVLYKDQQYQEVGTVGTESTTIKILHDLSVGDVLQFRVAGLAGGDFVGTAVHTTGNETVDGTKTFTSSPLVPTATSTDSSTRAASTQFVHNVVSGIMTCYDEVLDIASATSSGTNITLPAGMQYVVGSHMLMVSYNGTVCHVGENYNEVGTTGQTSNKIQMTFDMSVGDQLGFRIHGISDTATIPYDVVHTSGSETISGVKSFNSSPVVPTPSLGDYSNNVVTSKWVKDVSTAAVYVSPDGDDNNSGMTAAESVKTIGKAIEICDTLSQSMTNVILAAGSYSENIVISDKRNIGIILQGEVTVVGVISIKNGASLITSGIGTLTLSGQIFMYSQAFLLSQTTTTINATDDRVPLELEDGSIADFRENLNITVNSLSTSCGVQATNKSFFIHYKQLNIDCSNLTLGCVRVVRDSFYRAYGPLSISGSNNAHAIAITDVSGMHSSNTITVANGCIRSSVIFISGSSTLSITSGKTVIHGSSTANTQAILIYNNASIEITSGAELEIHIHNTGARLFYLYNCSTFKLNSGAKLSFIFYSNTNARYFLDLWECSSADISGTIDFGTGTVTSGVVDVTANSSLIVSSGVTLSGTITGKRYVVDYGGQVSVNGAGANVFPGDTAGTVSATTFGYYH